MSPTPPEGYRYYTPIAVRYGDMDTLGHVNNAKYLTYLEQARVSYFRDLPLWDGGLGSAGCILARVAIDYRLPVTMDDGTVDIWTRISRLGNKSMELEQVINCVRDGQTLTAIHSTSVAVTFDYVANASIVIPDDWRTRITSYEPALQAQSP